MYKKNMAFSFLSSRFDRRIHRAANEWRLEPSGPFAINNKETRASQYVKEAQEC
jgi:hypothetical protein